jgi:hypothetical protein
MAIDIFSIRNEIVCHPPSMCSDMDGFFYLMRGLADVVIPFNAEPPPPIHAS